MKKINHSFIFIILFSCSINKTINSDTNEYDINKIIFKQKSNVSLLNRIRSNPGVYISGNDEFAKVYIKGVTSINFQKEVLFILDGLQVGNYSKIVNIVDPSDIKSITVLKNASDIAIYGFVGSGGVIIIKTK
ncbi:MAG: TonB-dependent receptor plug domain-containing protein [Bacteroidota bacterium]|nr:TonB-dependent receptor plug domain-containing protein [Bacteroidota bacterium]